MTHDGKGKSISRNSAPENERVPRSGYLPRVSDTLITEPGHPDPSHHPEAAAEAATDEEAGAPAGGGITPLRKRPW